METVHFDKVSLGRGITAFEATSAGGPIVLIKGKSKKSVFKSRFDMQKAMFIDSIPNFKARRGELQNLVDAVNKAYKRE